MKCPGLRSDISAEALASKFLTLYQSEQDGFWEQYGFTPDSLVSDKGNLFRFLILAAYNVVRPFGRFENILSLDRPNSVHRVLLDEPTGIFSLERLTQKVHEWGPQAEENIDRILSGLEANGKHLNSKKKDPGGADFAKSFIDCMENISLIQELLKGAKTREDVLVLWEKLKGIHQIGNTIAAKIIKYTLREMGIGSVPRSELDLIAHHLLCEYHNNAFIKRLEQARKGLTSELEKCLSSDPMAIDTAFIIDREFCKKKDVRNCPLSEWHIQ